MVFKLIIQRGTTKVYSWYKYGIMFHFTVGVINTSMLIKKQMEKKGVPAVPMIQLA